MFYRGPGTGLKLSVAMVASVQTLGMIKKEIVVSDEFWKNFERGVKSGMTAKEAAITGVSLAFVEAIKQTAFRSEVTDTATQTEAPATASDDDYRLVFGKHIGKTLQEVPTTYLAYVAKTSRDKSIAERCQRVLKKRPEAASLFNEGHFDVGF